MSDDIFDRYRRFVAEGDKLTVVVLKGHLAIEELLLDILKSIAGNDTLLEEASLTFHQKRVIAQAHSGEHNTDKGWELIRILNTLRNDIGHNLDASRSSRLVNQLRQSLRQRDSKAYDLIPNPDNDSELVSHVVTFLIGFLEAYLREIRN